MEKVYRFSEVILTVTLMLSLKPVFWKKSVFYASAKVPK